MGLENTIKWKEKKNWKGNYFVDHYNNCMVLANNACCVREFRFTNWNAMPPVLIYESAPVGSFPCGTSIFRAITPQFGTNLKLSVCFQRTITLARFNLYTLVLRLNFIRLL